MSAAAASHTLGERRQRPLDTKHEKGILGAIEKFAAGLVGLGGYEWGTQSAEGTSFTRNPNKDCYTVLAQQLMGYSIGFEVTSTDVVGAPGGWGGISLHINPFHADAPLSNKDSGQPKLNWDCAGACYFAVFNLTCTS